MSNMGKQGILLMALGNPLYSKLAYNLAVSIKTVSPETHIAIIKNGDSLAHLDAMEKFFFDYKIECPAEYFTHEGNVEYLKAKLYLDKLTPFERTIFLDADMVFSPYKKAEDMFSDIGVLTPFTIACRNESKTEAGHSEWVTLEEVRKYYGFENWFDLSSEFIYFDKSKEVTEKIFEDARMYYGENLLNVREFAGGKPDEPFFCLSLLNNNLRPHKVPYKPSYWEYAEKEKEWIKEEQLWQNYYLLSIGGRMPSPRIEKIYNNIMKYFAHQKKVGTYSAIPKGRVLPERKLI